MVTPATGSPAQPAWPTPPPADLPGTPTPDEQSADEVGPTDRLLVTQARGGEAQAFESLLKRYQAMVTLVAYRQLGHPDQVEDVAQEAFVKAFMHLEDLDDPARFKSWLLRITANLALDFLRRRKNDGVSLDTTGAFAAAEESAAKQPGRGDLQEAQDHAQSDELRTQIVEAIYSLPEDYQVPAAMRYLEEVSYKEISRRLGLREETLRKRIHRANQMLRRKLKKLWPESDIL